MTDKDNTTSTTKSAIAEGSITITDEQSQLSKTGQTAEETIASLNRDTENAHDGPLAKPADLDALLREQAELTEAAAAAGKAVAKTVGDISQNLYATTGNEEWAEGGIYKTILQGAGSALVAQLGNGQGLEAALGAMASQLAAGKVGEFAKEVASELVSDPDAAKLVENLIINTISTGIGSVAGGTSGGNAASYFDRNNRQLHPKEVEKLNELFDDFKDQLIRDGMAEGMTDEDIYLLLLSSALYSTDSQWADLIDRNLSDLTVEMAMDFFGDNLGHKPINPPSFSDDVLGFAKDFIKDQASGSFVDNGVAYQYFDNPGDQSANFNDPTIFGQYISEYASLLDEVLGGAYQTNKDLSPSEWAYDRMSYYPELMAKQPPEVQEKILGEMLNLVNEYESKLEALGWREGNTSEEIEYYQDRMYILSSVTLKQYMAMDIDDRSDPVFDKIDRYASGAEAAFAASHRGNPGKLGAVNKGKTQTQAEAIKQSAGKPLPAGKAPIDMRNEYVTKVSSLKTEVDRMRGSGFSEEQIARVVSNKRRELGMQYKEYFSAESLEIVYKRNIEKYGDPLGPTPDYLRQNGKTWEEIIESSCRASGADISHLWESK